MNDPFSMRHPFEIRAPSALYSSSHGDNHHGEYYIPRFGASLDHQLPKERLGKITRLLCVDRLGPKHERGVSHEIGRWEISEQKLFQE